MYLIGPQTIERFMLGHIQYITHLCCSNTFDFIQQLLCCSLSVNLGIHFLVLYVTTRVFVHTNITFGNCAHLYIRVKSIKLIVKCLKGLVFRTMSINPRGFNLLLPQTQTIPTSETRCTLP